MNPDLSLTIQKVCEQYYRERDRFEKLATAIQRICEDMLANAGISAFVTSRAKTVDSFSGKLKRYVEKDNTEKIEKFKRADDPLCAVGDLSGVRIATYVEADVERVVELIKLKWGERCIDTELKNKNSGYRATHCQVYLPPNEAALPIYENISNTSAEIQVCSMLGHVWNEIEHDIIYKFNVNPEDKAMAIEHLRSLLDSTQEGDGYIESLIGIKCKSVASLMTNDVVSVFKKYNIDIYDQELIAVLSESVRLGYDTAEKIYYLFLESGGHEAIKLLNVCLKSFGELNELACKGSNLLLASLLHEHTRDLHALYGDSADNRSISRRVHKYVCLAYNANFGSRGVQPRMFLE